MADSNHYLLNPLLLLPPSAPVHLKYAHSLLNLDSFIIITLKDWTNVQSRMRMV